MSRPGILFVPNIAFGPVAELERERRGDVSHAHDLRVRPALTGVVGAVTPDGRPRALDANHVPVGVVGWQPRVAAAAGVPAHAYRDDRYDPAVRDVQIGQRAG